MRVGLDVGGTKIDAVVLDVHGAVRAQVRRPTGYGRAAVVDSIRAAIDELQAAAQVRSAEVTSVGIGIPGLVAPGSARVRHAVNLGVDDLDLIEALAGVVDAPIAAANDVKAAALGTHALHPGAASMAYLNLGTGVAAGIVVDGRLWTGAHGGAGEVGHISIDPDGPPCTCGQRGCIEVFVGGGALARRWGRAVRYPVADILDCADAGDDDARRLRADLVRGIAAAVRALVLALDVERVVIGGGLSVLAPRWAPAVREYLRTDATHSPFLSSLALDARMEVLPAGSPVAALGAALVGAAGTKGTDRRG